MKNKKYLYGLLVIVALLCLSIGYANISKVLKINGAVGTGNLDDLAKNYIVYFSEVSSTTKGTAVKVEAAVDAGAKPIEVTFGVSGMNQVNDEATLTYTIKNDSIDLYAMLNSVKFNDGYSEKTVTNGTSIKIGTNGMKELYEVTISWPTTNQINPNGEIELVVNIKMLAQTSTTANYSFTISLETTASSVGQSNN